MALVFKLFKQDYNIAAKMIIQAFLVKFRPAAHFSSHSRGKCRLAEFFTAFIHNPTL
jgi:hypothetical protein